MSRSLAEIRRIERRVHNYVGDKASSGDISTLLQRSCMPNAEVQQPLSGIVD